MVIVVKNLVQWEEAWLQHWEGQEEVWVEHAVENGCDPVVQLSIMVSRGIIKHAPVFTR
jgi:hypothetical protein